MEKQKNHFIPRCLLKRWIVNDDGYDGVHVLDLKTKEIHFSCSKGKKAYSFASINNLYILIQAGDRLTNLEIWFDGLENSFSIFIDKVTRQESDLFKHIEHLRKLVMGLVSFKFRSRYFFEKGIHYLEINPEIKNKFDGKSSFQIVLENVVNGTTDLTNQLFPIEFIVWESDIPLLLCDRPLFYEIVDGYSFFVLTPNLMLSFKRANNKSTISYQKINEDFAQKLNRRIIEYARDWIVSINKKELERIKDTYKFDSIDENIEFSEFKTLINGYEY